jgi:hypothetical protein
MPVPPEGVTVAELFARVKDQPALEWILDFGF